LRETSMARWRFLATVARPLSRRWAVRQAMCSTTSWCRMINQEQRQAGQPTDPVSFFPCDLPIGAPTIVRFCHVLSIHEWHVQQCYETQLKYHRCTVNPTHLPIRWSPYLISGFAAHVEHADGNECGPRAAEDGCVRRQRIAVHNACFHPTRRSRNFRVDCRCT
jgi:hypothetical protein